MSISILGPGAKVNENMQTLLQVAPPQLPPSVRPSKVFDTYWRFAAERQEIFFRRIAGASPPWTADPTPRVQIYECIPCLGSGESAFD
jgi:hypothetical protein